MKMRKLLICFLLFLPLGLAGCVQNKPPAETVSATKAQTTASTTEVQTEAAPTTFVMPQDLPEVDYDLSAVSNTMMYSQVYDMIYTPDRYLGKTVRVLGPFDQYTDEETGKPHCVCLIQDATACCTQGIEFELADTNTDLPPKGGMVLVSGTFDTFMNGPFLYCVLRDAVLE